jgi:hypothetical protein
MAEIDFDRFLVHFLVMGGFSPRRIAHYFSKVIIKSADIFYINGMKPLHINPNPSLRAVHIW